MFCNEKEGLIDDSFWASREVITVGVDLKHLFILLDEY